MLLNDRYCSPYSIYGLSQPTPNSSFFTLPCWCDGQARSRIVGRHDICKVNGGNSGHVGNSGQDSSCSESTAADAPAGGEASPLPHAASLTGGGVGGGRFAARTVAVRSYPRVQSSPHLPYMSSGALGTGCAMELPQRRHMTRQTSTGVHLQHTRA